MPLTASIRFENTGLLPAWPHGARAQGVTLPPSISYARGQLLGEQIGTNAVQSVTLGGATGGTFTLTFAGNTTAPIAWNATANAVALALQAIDGVALPSFAVTGAAGGPWTVTFAGNLGSTVQANMTGSAAGLTPGGSTVTIASVTAGVVGTPGLFAAYDPTLTNGVQIPRAVLVYSVNTDASGNVFWMASGVGEWAFSLPYVPAYFTGIFRCEDLVGLTDAAVTAGGWRLLNGNVGVGLVELPGV